VRIGFLDADNDDGLGDDFECEARTRGSGTSRVASLGPIEGPFSHDRESPVVELDTFGEQVMAEPVPAAGGRVENQPE